MNRDCSNLTQEKVLKMPWRPESGFRFFMRIQEITFCQSFFVNNVHLRNGPEKHVARYPIGNNEFDEPQNTLLLNRKCVNNDV